MGNWTRLRSLLEERGEEGGLLEAAQAGSSLSGF